jgi:membrane protein implicated in regulation of membrane protease activity
VSRGAVACLSVAGFLAAASLSCGQLSATARFFSFVVLSVIFVVMGILWLRSSSPDGED